MVICSSSEDFDEALRLQTLSWREHQQDVLREILTQLEAGNNVDLPPELPDPPWLRSQLPLLAVRAENVRVVFAPDVAHLRAWLATYSAYESEYNPDVSSATFPESSKSCPAAAENAAHLNRRIKKVVFVYNFLGVHRDTRHWKAQGLGNSVSALVECTKRNGMQSIIVEPKRYEDEGFVGLDAMIDDELPILNLREMKALARKLEEEDDGPWITQSVSIRQVLGRWFQFGPGPWDEAEERDVAYSDGHPPLHGEYPYSLPSFEDAPSAHDHEEDQHKPWDDEEQVDALHHKMEVSPTQASLPESSPPDHVYEGYEQDTHY